MSISKAIEKSDIPFLQNCIIHLNNERGANLQIKYIELSIEPNSFKQMEIFHLLENGKLLKLNLDTAVPTGSTTHFVLNVYKEDNLGWIPYQTEDFRSFNNGLLFFNQTMLTGR